MTKKDDLKTIGTASSPSDGDKGMEKMKQAKRIGCRENGEIDTRDAHQTEIYCSWPQLFQAREDVANQINRHGGYLRVAEPGMNINNWAHRINDYEGLGLIPGSIRPQDLFWDGLDINELIDRLSRISLHGVADLLNLPGYDPQLPGVLTCDIAGNCLLDEMTWGRSLLGSSIGRVARIEHIEELQQARRKAPYRTPLTPASVAKQGVQIWGEDKLPDRTVLSKRIPDYGYCFIHTRCLYCGTAIKVRGILLNGKPHREIDSQPICPHFRVRMNVVNDGENGEYVELQIIHEQSHANSKGCA